MLEPNGVRALTSAKDRQANDLKYPYLKKFFKFTEKEFMRGLLLLFNFFVTFKFSSEALAFKCFGKELSQISLAPQFPPTKNQYGGTCYGHQAAGIVSAALRRTTLKSPKECAISPEACAFQLCNMSEAANDQVKFAGKVLAPETLLDGSGKGAVQILNEIKNQTLIKESFEIEAKLRRAQADLKLSSEDKSALVELNVKIERLYNEGKLQIQKLRELDQDLKLDPANPTTAQELNAVLKNFDQNRAEYDELWEKRKKFELFLISKLCLKGLCEAIVSLPTLSPEQIHKIDVSEAEALWRSKKEDKKSQIEECKMKKEIQHRRLNMLLESLCMGIPVATDLKLNEEYVERRKKTEPNIVKDGGNHAVVLVGLFEKGGQQSLIFRNSWGEESELLTSPENICSITEAARLLVKSDEIPKDLEAKRQRLETLIKNELVAIKEVKLVDEPNKPETHQK